MGKHYGLAEDIRAATFIIAAFDSLKPEIADYACDGTNDSAQIQAAIDLLPT